MSTLSNVSPNDNNVVPYERKFRFHGRKAKNALATQVAEVKAASIPDAVKRISSMFDYEWSQWYYARLYDVNSGRKVASFDKEESTSTLEHDIRATCSVPLVTPPVPPATVVKRTILDTLYGGNVIVEA